jgi:hypothetical protein
MTTDSLPAPLFAVGDRVFSHYVMGWGQIVRVDPAPASNGSRWYRVSMDDGSSELFDDAGGDWMLARIVPPAVAQRYGYGTDPRA